MLKVFFCVCCLWPCFGCLKKKWKKALPWKALLSWTVVPKQQLDVAKQSGVGVHAGPYVDSVNKDKYILHFHTVKNAFYRYSI